MTCVGCGYIEEFLNALVERDRRFIRTYNPCWLIAILFTNLFLRRKSLQTLSNVSTRYLGIGRAFFVCAFRFSLPYFHENSIYNVCLNEHTVPEKGLHCVGGCVFFQYTNSPDGDPPRPSFLMDTVNLNGRNPRTRAFS